jgi:anti-anti-sigma factor
VLEKRQMEGGGHRRRDQRSCCPADLPQLSSGSLAAHSRPARRVSGDYYDVLPLDQDKVALLVCDVAGKGIPAAMVMIMIRSITHLLVSPRLEAAATLTGINRGITGRIDVDHFATIGLCIYDQANRQAVYANAAHLPLLVYRASSSKLLRVDAEGLPIGVEREGKYGQRRFELERGDILILCTDGILEAMSPKSEQYGLKRLADVVRRLLPAWPGESHPRRHRAPRRRRAAARRPDPAGTAGGLEERLVSGNMEIKLRRADTIYVIDVVGEMDLYSAFKLKDVVRKMIEKKIRHYVINLDQVPYIDSSGIGALLQVFADIKKNGLRLRITGVKGSVRKVIELTKLAQYFPIVADLELAIQQLKASE